MQRNVKYRVKYWRWINEQAGEWYRTGLMTQESAEKVAESLRQSHEQMDCRDDEYGGVLFSRGDFERVRRAIKLAMEG